MLPASSGQKLSPLRKNDMDVGERGPLTAVFRVTDICVSRTFYLIYATVSFPTSISSSYLFICFCFYYLFIYCYSFHFSYFIFLRTYEHCLPCNSCDLITASTPHCLFLLCVLVLFILHISSYLSLSLFLTCLLCFFIFTCGIYHKTALFKGPCFLWYFSHTPSPSTP